MSDVSTPEFNEEGKYLRKVKSFVLREGRLTKGQEQAFKDYWKTHGIDYKPEPTDFAALFGNNNPVTLEIGFGMGASLVEMAKAAPEKNFVGIEVHKPGVGACLMAAGEAGVTNLRVYHHDGVEVMAHCIGEQSIDTMQLFFPDPWHKKRHHKRRIVQIDFAKQILSKLKVGGVFHMATDWENYAEHMIEVMDQVEGFENIATNGNYVERPADRPLTKFENRGKNLGHGVWDIKYRRKG